MISKIKTIITSLMVLGLFAVPALTPAVASAAVSPILASSTTANLCHGANLSVTGSGSCDSKAGTDINGILTFVLNLFSIIVGVAAVIMITIGGLKYVLSGGDSTRVSGAKDTILFAIVGLVVVALAQIIVHFVLHSVAAKL